MNKRHQLSSSVHHIMETPRTSRTPPSLLLRGASRGSVTMTATIETRIAHRYDQRDIDALGGVCERWRRLVQGNAVMTVGNAGKKLLPLGSEETELLRGLKIVLAVLGRDAGGQYRLISPLLKPWDAA